MKKLLMLAAAAAAILPMTAQADTNPTATGSVEVTTFVEDTCAISGLTDGGGDAGFSRQFINNNGGLATASTQPWVKFESGDLVDATNARATVASHIVKLSAFCNYAQHNVSLESEKGGLTTSDNASTNGIFNRRIAYNAKISNWGGVSGDLAPLNTGTDATFLTSNTTTVKRAFTEVPLASHSTGTTVADLTITTVASTVPLVQGAYSDVLKIRLGRRF
jgi:hypothetical protein